MTCKDCIHYNVCVIVEHRVDDDEDHLSEFGCEDFINKNDVVEVVRCKDCVLHTRCFIEDHFKFAVLENPCCCVGKKVE